MKWKSKKNDKENEINNNQWKIIINDNIDNR